jgi:hypothetical protein
MRPSGARRAVSPKQAGFAALPLEDIRNTERIAAVVFGGKLLRRADLDALLAEAEQLAKND